MVTINGNPFKTYQLDTIDTFRQRVAANFDSLSLYIIFKPKLEKLEGNFEVIDILQKIKEDNDIVITSIYKEYEQYFSNPLDLIKPWLAYNKTLENDKMFQFAAVESIKDIINNFDAQAFLDKDKKNYKSLLEKKISNNKKEIDKLVKVFSSFQNVQGIDSTDFETDTISLTILLSLTEVSLLEIFNSLVLNTMIPFANIKDFFKIYRNLKPPLTWSFSLPNAIFLQVSTDISEELVSLEKYRPVFITLNEDRVAVKIELDTNRKEKSLTRPQIINRVLNSISGYNFSIISEEEEKLKGVFYYPAQSINKYIFADLVMNDPLFSILLNIDEWSKATKAKPSIYFYYTQPQNSEYNVSVVMTPKIMNRSDSEFKTLDPDLFPLNEPYLRIRISNAKNYLSVENFQNSFSKLLELYNKHYDRMLEFYRKFIPNFGKIEEISEGKSHDRLKDIEPEIFLPLYTKKCNRKPVIVDRDTALEKGEGEWMMFPASPEEGKQHYYICPHKQHKYPGLFVNNLANRDRFPYLPCCYAKDRRFVKGSNYRKYFEGEKEDEEKEQQTILLTGKTATSVGFGILPPSLDRFFKLIDINSIYYRKGMARSNSSFLECILEALHETTDFLRPPSKGSLTDKIRVSRTTETRKKIATWKGLAVGRQELFDMSTEDISNDINNMNVYLDPKKFIRILESYFKCNIFLFSKENITGQMQLPRFSQAYLRFQLMNRPTILIYEHWGGKSEELKYPQCELIVRWDGKSEVPLYSLMSNEIIVQELNSVLERIRLVYNFDPVPPVTLPHLEKLNLKSQIIDSYGKTRVLNISFDGTIYSLITEPIPPLILPEVQKIDFKPWTLEKALNFVKFTSSQIIKQNIYKGILKELYIKYGTISVILPLKDTTPIFNVKTIETVPFIPFHKTSNFLQYNYLKKSARYLTEYFIYFFSVYIYEENIEEVTSKDLENFIRNRVIIIDDYIYENIDRKFTLNSTVFQGNKLVVPSEEVIRRLLYILRLKLQQQFSEVREYRNQKIIKNYYVDLNDFDVHPEQIILQGRDSIKKWIESPENLNILNHEILFNQEQPYFFKNELVKGDIYLAQNVSNFTQGINIGKTWAESGYNPITSGEDKEGLTFNLYSYISKNEIIPYKVIGKENSYKIKILGYKKDNINTFTVLMPLNGKN
jgi:hypothetical protein